MRKTKKRIQGLHSNVILEKKDKIKLVEILSIGLSIVGIFLATYIGLITYSLQIKSMQQEQKIKNFDTLISKTNSILLKLDRQLTLNDSSLRLSVETESIHNQEAEYNNTGDLNRFYVAIQRLGSTIGYRSDILNLNPVLQDEIITKCKPIFESQMNNKYLLQNLRLTKSWVNAYKYLSFFSRNNVFDSSFNPEFYGRPKTRLDELNKIEFKRDFASCWEAVNSAYELAQKQLIADKKFLKLN